MPTINQLVRKGRKRSRRKSDSPALEKAPHQRGVVLFVGVIKPKKPNSANRFVARVRLSNGRTVGCYVPGEGGRKLQEHSQVLVQGGVTPDLPGYHYKVVLGTKDAPGIPNRRRSRSRYGAARPRGSVRGT